MLAVSGVHDTISLDRFVDRRWSRTGHSQPIRLVIRIGSCRLCGSCRGGRECGVGVSRRSCRVAWGWQGTKRGRNCCEPLRGVEQIDEGPCEGVEGKVSIMRLPTLTTIASTWRVILWSDNRALDILARLPVSWPSFGSAK